MQIPSKQISQIDHAAAGSEIRKFRLSKKKSLRWLAEKMGYKPPFLSDLERGRRNWTVETYELAGKILRRVK